MNANYIISSSPYDCSPKILPWLAARACVDASRAEQLWRQALADARMIHSSGSAEQAAQAVELLRHALDQEAKRAPAVAHLRVWQRMQRRLSYRFLDWFGAMLRVVRVWPQHGWRG